jgi:uncharacterized protein YydD (DUF2326 family)
VGAVIHSIYSSLPSFKSLAFHSGLNIVTAEKTPGASVRQTRNGAGKSSILDIVHFILGGSCVKPKGDPQKDCPFRLPALSDYFFGLSFDMANGHVSAERTGSNPQEVVVEAENTSHWPHRPVTDRESGQQRMRVKDWNSVLGAEFFGLPSVVPKHGPKFRAVFPYFARRQIDGGLAAPQSFFEKQSVGDQQVALSFLFGLDWRVSQELQLVRDKKRSFETIRREANKGVLQRFVGNAGELRSQLKVAQNKADQLRKQIEAFQVLPEYHDLEREASSLANRLSQLANENAIDEERLEMLRAALAAESEPDMKDVVNLFQEAGVVLSGLVVHRIEEIKAFHQAVLRNRRSHLETEIVDSEQRLGVRRNQMNEADARRLQILAILSAHGALDQLTRLQEEAARLLATTEDLRRQYNDAKTLEALKSEINLEIAKLNQSLIRDIEEHQEVIDAAVILFEEFSGSLSEHQGHLTVEATEQGPKFDTVVPSGRSVGIKNMQIFCFDLTLITLWTRKHMGPGFLIHDSHLFDGVDSRQVAKAIEIGAERAEAEGFQYIITLNSDMLPLDEFSRDFNVEEYILDVHLDDSTDTGGLFGFRF